MPFSKPFSNGFTSDKHLIDKTMNINKLNEFCKNTLVEHLEINFTEAGENYIEATMPVNSKKLQPSGVLHGGASIALAETVSGAGSFLLIDRATHDAFGLQVSGNHTGMTSSGIVKAKALLIHKGKTTHIWDVAITDEKNKLITTTRVTNMIIEKKK